MHYFVSQAVNFDKELLTKLEEVRLSLSPLFDQSSDSSGISLTLAIADDDRHKSTDSFC